MKVKLIFFYVIMFSFFLIVSCEKPEDESPVSNSNPEKARDTLNEIGHMNNLITESIFDLMNSIQASHIIEFLPSSEENIITQNASSEETDFSTIINLFLSNQENGLKENQNIFRPDSKVCLSRLTAYYSLRGVIELFCKSF